MGETTVAEEEYWRRRLDLLIEGGQITPRDFFAGCVLIRDAIWCASNNEGWSEDKYLFAECFRVADAMMKQREVE